MNWGETGEFVIAGAGLARYLDDEMDRIKFAPLPSIGWSRAHQTGDLVRADPQGLVFISRNDDQVKIGGRHVELGEIDAALMMLLGVSAAASTIHRSETGTPLLIGYIVRDTGASNTDRGILRAHLGVELAQVHDSKRYHPSLALQVMGLLALLNRMQISRAGGWTETFCESRPLICPPAPELVPGLVCFRELWSSHLPKCIRVVLKEQSRGATSL